MATETTLAALHINVLTKAQFDAAEKDPDQLYLVTDAEEESTGDIDCGTF